VCAWIAACAWATASAAAAEERPAADVVEAIVREGPRAIAIRSGVEVVRREQEARRVFPNPDVVYSREGAGFTEFFQAAQSLPVFGLRAALARAGLAAAAAAEAERDARLWELRADATELVTRLLWAQARAEAAEAHTQEVARLVDVMRVREREGEGSRFDRLRTEHELADLRLVAVGARVSVSDVRGAVSALLPAGVPLTSVTGGLVDQPAEVDVESLVRRAHDGRAELRALRAAGDRTTREADAARRSRWPLPVASGGVKRSEVGDGRVLGAVFGVSLAVPLFDTGSIEAARWTAEGARIAADRAAIEQRVRAEIVRASEALVIRQRALDEADADALGAELVRTAEVAYREGEVGILQLLDAVRAAARARMRQIERRLEVRLARIALERAVGVVLWP
jgi:cobalt-zinc-cadmium efflux system outer membrane protein